MEILRRVRLEGYQGGKSALYALVATLRPKETRATMRFEGLPGEFTQHDFGEVQVSGHTESKPYARSLVSFS